MPFCTGMNFLPPRKGRQFESLENCLFVLFWTIGEEKNIRLFYHKIRKLIKLLQMILCIIFWNRLVYVDVGDRSLFCDGLY